MAMGVDAASPVSFGGLQSGLDSNGIIDAAVKVAEQPIRHLERQQAILMAHNETYTQISGLLRSFQTSLQQLDSHTSFNHLMASSSNDQVVSATAGAGTAANSHRIQVLALASVQRSYSDPVQSAQDSGYLGVGTLKLSTPSGASMQLDVDEQTTLQNVANAINDAGVGASAAIIYEGEGYRLQVTGSSSGRNQTISFEDAGLKLNLSAARNTPQVAQDAQFRLDDFSTISRASNVISDVIPGVTLQLHAVSEAIHSVSTSVDTHAILAQIDNFVEAYNAIANSISKSTHYDGVTDHAKSVGDTTLSALKRNLQAAIGQPIAGLDADLRALTQVGIASQKDGSLKLDKQKLTAAVTADPHRVARLFVFDPNLQTHGVAAKLQKMVTQYTTAGTGTLTVSIDSMVHRQEALKIQMSKAQENVKKYEATLRDKYTRLEKNMAQIKSQNSYIDSLKPQPPRR